jgi:hypothetical protein
LNVVRQIHRLRHGAARCINVGSTQSRSKRTGDARNNHSNTLPPSSTRHHLPPTPIPHLRLLSTGQLCPARRSTLSLHTAVHERTQDIDGVSIKSGGIAYHGGHDRSKRSTLNGLFHGAHTRVTTEKGLTENPSDNTYRLKSIHNPRHLPSPTRRKEHEEPQPCPSIYTSGMRYAQASSSSA